jgi:hypothetical protein
MARQTLAEIINDLKKKPTPEEKIQHLKTNATPALFFFLQIAFRPEVIWELPEGCPPYTPHKGRPGSAPSELSVELRRLYLYLRGGEPGLKQLKRELMFARLLSELDPAEVEIILALKEKTFGKIFCSSADAVAAFPTLLTAPFDGHFIR